MEAEPPKGGDTQQPSSQVPSVFSTRLAFVRDSSVVSLCSFLSQKHLPQWVETLETLDSVHLLGLLWLAFASFSSFPAGMLQLS